MKIHIFLIDKARYTPFDINFIPKDLEYLESQGIQLVNHVKKADIFVATHPRKIKKFILHHPLKKNFLLWTNEPRNSQTSKKSYLSTFLLRKVNVMNAFTRNIFVSNVS